LPEAVFVSRQGPVDPVSYGSGRLGIVLPTYYQRYLFLAYRALSGNALHGTDLDAALQLPPTSVGENQPGYLRWQAVRDSLVSGGRRHYLSVYCARQQGNTYYFYPNYYDDAFRTAAVTLVDRVRRQGRVDDAVRDWARAQDAVFTACEESAAAPQPVAAGSPDWLVKDRAYQVASWNFYAGHFDEAAAGFHAIAADPASPWREWGAYLAARAYVRKGTVTPDPREPDRDALAQAERQLKAIVDDPSLSARHESAQRLLAFVGLRLRPEGRLGDLSSALRAKSSSFTQQVFDLTVLLDRFSPQQVDSLAHRDPAYDMPDWILTFQARNATHALERWRQTRSTPWMVAALASAPAPEADLMQAAARIRPDDPAFASVAFHRARLLANSDKEQEARRVLDELPQTSFPVSSWNAVLALRMRLAKSLDDMLTSAPRMPDYLDYGGFGLQDTLPNPRQPLLDRDAALVLNRWAPTSSVADAAAHYQRPSLRQPLLIAAWTRAVVVGDDKTANALSGLLTTGTPALATYLNAYDAAHDPASRRFEATWLILHIPGMTPWVRWGVGRQSAPTERDIFRDNWWPVEHANQRAWFLGGEDTPAREPESWTNPPGWDARLAPTLFTQAERAQAERERAEITHAGPGANFVCAQTLAWARSHPNDPRLPEALHLCVQATRYGYTDEATSSWSRQAFTLLHRRFPATDWAKKTKYWY
jgi:hypothetical protein